MSIRFAPSPTGALHFGNFRTAWVSHAFASSLSLPWVVRFEDIDRPRVVPGAMERQLKELEQLRLKPDRVLLQSERRERHESLFRRAVDSGQVYPCTCSRKEILEDLAGIASAPHGEAPLYNGRCRKPSGRTAGHSGMTLAWRFLNGEDPSGTRDFIVARTNPEGGDFAPAYHWACAIDDYDGEHALLVRAWDLVSAAGVQRRIHAWVGELENRPLPFPAIFHTTLVLAGDGRRLEKRTQGVTLPELLGQGVSVEDLRARFKKSFDPLHLKEFESGKIWGEPRKELQISEI